MNSRSLHQGQDQEVMKLTIIVEQSDSTTQPDALESKLFDAEEFIQFSNTYTDAVVVSAVINGFEVNKILVDTGSSVNTIYQQQAVEMGLSLKDYDYSSRILQGFNGTKCRPEGEITLPVCWGEETNYLTYDARFVMLKSDSQYNCIFGRPLLNQFDAFVSTKRMMVKMPTPYGIATIRANIPEARQCYVNSWNSHQSTRMVKPLHPTLSSQKILVEKTQPKDKGIFKKLRESDKHRGRTKAAESLPSSFSLLHIVAILKRRGLCEKPHKMKMPYEKHNSGAYCSFHEQRGHDTQRCYKLKQLLNKLTTEGHLHEILAKEEKNMAKASTSKAERW